MEKDGLCPVRFGGEEGLRCWTLAWEVTAFLCLRPLRFQPVPLLMQDSHLHLSHLFQKYVAW